MQYNVYLAVVVSCLSLVVADIQFTHCLGPGDIGDLWKRGIYPNVCVNNHTFNNETHPWSFWKSIVKNSTFSSCTFADTPERKMNFNGTTWKDVIFKDCDFGNEDMRSAIEFTHTSFQGVLFDGCVFHKEASVLFENFVLENTEFRNCTFYSDTSASLGFIRSLTIDESRFLASPDGTVREGNGSLTFSEVTVDRLSFQDSFSEASIRFQDATVENLGIQDSEIGSLACHEEIIAGRDAERKSELDETMIFNVSMSDGMYCDQTTFSGLHLEDVRVRNTLNLCKTDIENLVVIDVTSLSNETCSEFALCSAEIRGEELGNVTTSKITFAQTVFSEAMLLQDFSVLTTTADLTDTIFSQERINNECCTESCLSRGCKCDVSLEPLFCPAGNSSVNVNVKDSCFPADSTVSAVNGFGRIEKTTMRDLRHGHRVLHSHDAPASEVFFFGHRTQQPALYKVFKTLVSGVKSRTETRTLAISPGHLLPVIGRGVIPARDVQIGDALVTEEGDKAIVAEVTNEIRQGMYAPTTLRGELAVDGIQVSCYTDIVPSWFAHVALAPVRAIYGLGGHASILVTKFNIFHDTSFSWVAELVKY